MADGDSGGGGRQGGAAVSSAATELPLRPLFPHTTVLTKTAHFLL